jgi:hypothetical protein
MLSQKQLIANRNNCLKSTGPRSLEGKRNASRNAVRHGLLSDSGEILLKGENQDQFDTFHQNLLINLDPQGQLELLLTERITGFFWKLKRAGRMEKGLLDILCNPSSDSDPSPKKNSLPFTMITTKTYQTPSDDPEYQDFKKFKQQQALACGLELPEGKIVDRETFQSIPGLRRTEKEVTSVTDSSSAESLGRAVRQDFQNGSFLERLLRYEGQIERGLYRALTELQKFQFLRRRNDAIDVEMENAEKPNEAILSDSQVVILSEAKNSSSLDSLLRLSETKTDGLSSIDSVPNEANLNSNLII